MTPRTVFVKTHKFSSTDRLFLDTNIWLYLHGPHEPQASKLVKTYSDAFKRILSAQCQIYVDVTVISEFINRYTRMQWKLAASHFREFKDFRKSPFFKLHVSDIVADAKLVMRHCVAIESGFDRLNIDTLLDVYADGKSDFNDQIIVELCKRKGLILLTHDGDFKDSDLSILTANRSLLA